MTMPRRVTIAHVLNGLKYGGVENLCLQLMKNSPASFRHVLFNMDPSRTDMKDVFMTSCPDLTIVDRRYTKERRLPFAAGMASDLHEIKADGVLVYTFGLHLFVALAARLAGVRRVVVHAGNPPPIEGKQRRLWRAIVIASLLLRVPIKSCSVMVDRELRALSGTLPAGSEALPNGVDVDAIASLAAREQTTKALGDPRVIGMVARLNSIKDHDTLLRAYALVRGQLGGCELWLIGDGELRPTLLALAAELGITESTRFLGERPDVHRLLAYMDVFAFSTTRNEGFGIVLAEAMAARVPIVASDVEACREVLADGQFGLLVTPGNAQELAAAVTRLLTQPDMADALAERALTHARLRFDIKACAERYYAALAPDWKASSHG